MDTETIDKLFLELSQFTTAKSEREIELENEIKTTKRVQETTEKYANMGWKKVDELEKEVKRLNQELIKQRSIDGPPSEV